MTTISAPGDRHLTINQDASDPSRLHLIAFKPGVRVDLSISRDDFVGALDGLNLPGVTVSLPTFPTTPGSVIDVTTNIGHTYRFMRGFLAWQAHTDRDMTYNDAALLSFIRTTNATVRVVLDGDEIR